MDEETILQLDSEPKRKVMIRMVAHVGFVHLPAVFTQARLSHVGIPYVVGDVFMEEGRPSRAASL